MLIFLIGYMGCGKSTIGRKLSKQLGWNLVDTDAAIEHNAGMTISDIFEQYGEEHFRSLERAVLLNLIESDDSYIVSTGGGLPMWGDNMELMNRSGESIYLNRSAVNIASRLSEHGRQKRPKLRGLNDEELVEFMTKGIAERDPIYRKANLTLDVVPMADRDIVATIMDYLVRKQR